MKLSINDFSVAFAYSITKLSPPDKFLVNVSLHGFFYEITSKAFSDVNKEQEFKINQIKKMINEKSLLKVPTIKAMIDFLKIDVNDLVNETINQITLNKTFKHTEQL